MKPSDAVREIMADKKVGTNALARLMGKSPRLVSERLGQNGITVEKLQEMLSVMDYKVIIVPGGRALREGEYDISKAGDEQ